MSSTAIPPAKFRIGKIISTPNALAHLSQDDILLAIQRHQAGDWGEVPASDSAANERALIERTRLWSVYRSPKGTKFWLITDADRRMTTILMPEDY